MADDISQDDAKRERGHEFKLSDEPGFKHRILEVAITTICSAIVAAVTVSWRVSGAWTSVQAQQERLLDNQLRMETRLTAVEATLKAGSETDQAQTVAIAESKAHGEDIVRRLSSIETKIDIIGEKQRQ